MRLIGVKGAILGKLFCAGKAVLETPAIGQKYFK